MWIDGVPPVSGISTVCVGTTGVSVLGTNGVLVGINVDVAMLGVALFTPMITGVGVKIDGVFVGGRKGVGGV